MVEAINKELMLQKDFLRGETISSIYFGGGTPSLLTLEELKALLRTINMFYPVDPEAEITLEANPDDLNKKVLQQFYENGINRLSIGIQTFNDTQLKFLNRTHNAPQAEACVHLARAVGFKNISIDLIYGIPSEDHTIWKTDLAHALSLNPEHISSYCLTIEPATVFGHWLKKGKMKPMEEEYAAIQFEILTNTLSMGGYEQYEISNFCKPGFYSRHNSNYWKQKKYLGVGPGAHSYNHDLRQFNISNNAKYLQALEENIIPAEKDLLDYKARINEYLMTSLRTKWGCDLDWIKQEFNYDLRILHSKYLKDLLHGGFVILKENTLTLTNKGKLLADKITEDLFIT